MVEFRLRRLEEVSSTNSEVKRALEAGESEGLAVVARQQTAGYGRQGRTWASPEGGLYVSLLLCPSVPPAQLPTLSLAAGIAVRRALVELLPAFDSTASAGPTATTTSAGATATTASAGATSAAAAATPHVILSEGAKRRSRRIPYGTSQCSPEAQAQCIQLKWPNDLVVAGPECHPGFAFRKLCGISLEAHAGGVCVGIGVNVCPPSQPAEAGGKNSPVYLADLGFPVKHGTSSAVSEVCSAVLAEFSTVYEQWLSDGFEALCEEYNAASALRGREVRIADLAGSQLARGEVAGVASDGRLLLRTSSGDAVAIASGEAHLVPLDAVG